MQWSGRQLRERGRYLVILKPRAMADIIEKPLDSSWSSDRT
jgi:hypothetical protein